MDVSEFGTRCGSGSRCRARCRRTRPRSTLGRSYGWQDPGGAQAAGIGRTRLGRCRGPAASGRLAGRGMDGEGCAGRTKTRADDRADVLGTSADSAGNALIVLSSSSSFPHSVGAFGGRFVAWATNRAFPSTTGGFCCGTVFPRPSSLTRVARASAPAHVPLCPKNPPVFCPGFPSHRGRFSPVPEPSVSGTRLA